MVWSVPTKGQTNDLIYVVNDNSLIGTIKYKNIGWYLGGQVLTSFPTSNTYTTPYVSLNRWGLDVTLFPDVSIMFGSTMPNGIFPFEFNPDLWIKMRVFNTIKKKDEKLDLTLIANPTRNPFYGFGLSIPLQ